MAHVLRYWQPALHSGHLVGLCPPAEFGGIISVLNAAKCQFTEARKRLLQAASERHCPATTSHMPRGF